MVTMEIFVWLSERDLGDDSSLNFKIQGKVVLLFGSFLSTKWMTKGSSQDNE